MNTVPGWIRYEHGHTDLNDLPVVWIQMNVPQCTFIFLLLLPCLMINLHSAEDDAWMRAFKQELPEHYQELHRAGGWWQTPGSHILYQVAGETVAEAYFYTNGNPHKCIHLKEAKQERIDREWYENGHIKSVLPMRGELLHGLCKEWNDDGSFAGSYHMLDGSGNVLLTFADGTVSITYAKKDGRNHGKCVIFYPNGNVSSLFMDVDGEIRGNKYFYFEDGSPRAIGLEYSAVKKLNIFVIYAADGAVEKITYTINDNVVEEQVFVEALADKPQSLPYCKDPLQYKNLIPAQQGQREATTEESAFDRESAAFLLKLQKKPPAVPAQD